MIVCVDVDYRAHVAVTGCVGIRQWIDAAPAFEHAARRAVEAEPYVPGSFYRRELPCLLDALKDIPRPDVVVVDGFVWLGPDRPGLGAHLHAALHRSVVVIGIAKGAFRGASPAVKVLRGKSTQPLFVTAAGMDANDAADAVRSMHGSFRLPTIVKRADRLARDS